MNWPHDPDGEAGSEGGRKYGHAIFAKKVDEEADFPLDMNAFAEEYGEDPIRIDNERVVPASKILESVDVDSVDDIVEFHRALGRVMRDEGYWAYERERYAH